MPESKRSPLAPHTDAQVKRHNRHGSSDPKLSPFPSMQSSTSTTDDIILRPAPQAAAGDTVHERTPPAPPSTAAAAPAEDEAQGGSRSRIPDEPTPHPSTKPEVLKLKDPAIKDFGWNSPPSAVPSPLVHGLSNDDLWVLIRRFNKQIFNVRAIDSVPGLLDLEVSENEEFSPDKLRATLERFYMDVIVGVAAFFKHIARLRSWNEPRRTAWFALAYFAAWWFNILLPTLFVTLMVLIVDPPTRKLLFPPAPLAAISAASGNVQKPKAGTLGSKDSLSGAPEAHKGEAVEQEARHFVAGLGSMAIATAAGKGPGDDGNGNAVGGGDPEAEGVDKPATAVEGIAPDPTGMAAGAVEAKHLASGDNAAKDPAKVPVEAAMWSKAMPVMRVINDISDTWERFGNALSPQHPFPYWEPRLKLAGPMLPLALITYFISAAFFLRVTTFIFGIVFFGQPLLIRGLHELTHRVPHWQKYLELRRTLLAGVPTNAQLTLTLLRIAERNHAPLPPPPTSEQLAGSDSEDETDSFDGSSYDVDSDSEDYTDQVYTEKDYADGDEGEAKKRKPGRKIAAALKRTVKAGVGGALGVDHLKAKVGSEQAKNRLGAVAEPPPSATMHGSSSGSGSHGSPAQSEQPAEVARVNLPGGEGPCVFSARLRGRKGHVILVNSATSPCISFAYTKLSKSLLSALVPGHHDKPQDVDVDLKPEFTMGISDIREIRKIGGYGWKSKMIIGWATGREILDGLEITDAKGQKVNLTSIRGRDELFNRLIAMGEHKWEAY